MVQDVEIFNINGKSQFLQIHKNGCTYVRDVIHEVNIPLVLDTPRPNLLLWAVIREPYDRLLSGLTYDLYRHRPEYFQNDGCDDLINHFQVNDIIRHSIQYQRSDMRESGNIPHTIPQSVYLLQQPVGMYVNIEDLSEFCYTHFDVRRHEKHSTLNDHKAKVKYAIESVDGLRQRIDDYLAIDYYIYSMIHTSRNVWCWQYGKIF